MTPAEVDDFLRSERVCVLASLGPDGLPDPLPMWYVIDDAGRIVMRTYAKSQKVKNLERDPRASALVEAGDRYAELRGVQLTGTVRLDPDPELVVDTWTGLMVKYEGFDAEQAAGFRRVAAAKAATQVALVLEPTRVVSWDHRKLG